MSVKHFVIMQTEVWPAKLISCDEDFKRWNVFALFLQHSFMVRTWMAVLPSVYPDLRFRQDNVGSVSKDQEAVASAPCTNKLGLNSERLWGGFSLMSLLLLTEIKAH